MRRGPSRDLLIWTALGGAVLFAFCTTRSARAAITWDKSGVTAVTNSSTCSVVLSLAAARTAVFGAYLAGGGATINSITQSSGSATWTVQNGASGTNSPTTYNTETWTALTVAANAAQTITATFDSSRSAICGVAFYSGVASIGATNFNAVTGASVSAVTVAVTTTATNSWCAGPAAAYNITAFTAAASSTTITSQGMQVATALNLGMMDSGTFYASSGTSCPLAVTDGASTYHYNAGSVELAASTVVSTPVPLRDLTGVGTFLWPPPRPSLMERLRRVEWALPEDPLRYILRQHPSHEEIPQ